MAGAIAASSGVLAFVLIWLIAHTNKFFAFVKEGEGYSVVTTGGKLVFIDISFRGHRILAPDQIEPKTGKVSGTWRVVEGEPSYPNPIRGFLARHGIFWVGFYPFEKLHLYELKWSEWKKDEDGNYVPWYRTSEKTPSFFVKTFEYALQLKAAEARGNVPVNMSYSLFLRIVAPEVALFRNDDWFEAVSTCSLALARNYVGKLDFENLRAEAETENGQNREQTDIFSNLMVSMNSNDNTDTPNVLDLMGVEVVQARIIEVGVYDPKNQILEATTERYRKEQEAAGIRAVGKAQAEVIEMTGEATAKAIHMETEAVDASPSGAFVRRQRAFEKASEAGKATFVFTDDGRQGGVLGRSKKEQ
jgi:regulator of protease activity HflC (stomatin/prohibitin superfamily)